MNVTAQPIIQNMKYLRDNTCIIFFIKGFLDNDIHRVPGKLHSSQDINVIHLVCRSGYRENKYLNVSLVSWHCKSIMAASHIGYTTL